MSQQKFCINWLGHFSLSSSESRSILQIGSQLENSKITFSLSSHWILFNVFKSLNEINYDESDIDNLVNFSRVTTTLFLSIGRLGSNQPCHETEMSDQNEDRTNVIGVDFDVARAKMKRFRSPSLSFFSTRCRFPDSRTLLPHQEEEEEVFCASRDEKESSKVERCGPVCSVKNRSNRFVRRLPKKKGKESLFKNFFTCGGKQEIKKQLKILIFFSTQKTFRLKVKNIQSNFLFSGPRLL